MGWASQHAAGVALKQFQTHAGRVCADRGLGQRVRPPDPNSILHHMRSDAWHIGLDLPLIDLSCYRKTVFSGYWLFVTNEPLPVTSFWMVCDRYTASISELLLPLGNGSAAVLIHDYSLLCHLHLFFICIIIIINTVFRKLDIFVDLMFMCLAMILHPRDCFVSLWFCSVRTYVYKFINHLCY